MNQNTNDQPDGKPPYEYEHKTFTYSSPHDSWLKRLIINIVELASGRKYIQRVYDELHQDNPTPFNVWPRGLEKMNYNVEYDKTQLEKVPKKGPVIFVANHPYGVPDGAILLYLVTQMRKDWFILINEVVSHEPILKDHFLPVDFRKTDDALETNLRTKELTTERLNNGECLAIFPSGAVATQTRFFGPVVEFPWRRFICTRIHETQCTVVPVYFTGKNSWLFHFVSKFSMNLRLGLLLHETMNKRGKTFQVEIGDPIPYSEMEPIEDRQKLIEFLREKTMALRKGGIKYGHWNKNKKVR